MTRLVRIVSVCSSCFALSRGVCPFSSSAFFLFRYVRLCLVMSALSRFIRPFLSCPSCLVPFVWSRSVLVRVVRLVLSYPSRVRLLFVVFDNLVANQNCIMLEANNNNNITNATKS